MSTKVVKIDTAQCIWYGNITLDHNRRSLYVNINPDPNTQPTIIVDGAPFGSVGANGTNGYLYHNKQWYVFLDYHVERAGRMETIPCEPTQHPFLDKIPEIIAHIIQGGKPQFFKYKDKHGQPQEIELYTVNERI